MIRKTLFAVFSILYLVMPALTQESGLPACSDGNLRIALFDTADRFISLYEAIDDARSVDDLLENYQKLLNWRDEALRNIAYLRRKL